MNKLPPSTPYPILSQHYEEEWERDVENFRREIFSSIPPAEIASALYHLSGEDNDFLSALAQAFILGPEETHKLLTSSLLPLLTPSFEEAERILLTSLQDEAIEREGEERRWEE